jgi:hypothetical protein
MNINVLVMALLSAIIGLYTWRAFLHQNEPPPSQLPWVPIDVNKQRSFVNQTRDAGMYTERARRVAIIGNPTGVFSYKGSTNGSLEWNFLTGICVCPGRLPQPVEPVCPPAPNVVLSAGDADDEICDNIDAGGAFGGYEAIDFGGATGNDCDV